jgi:hypothetical protein
MTKRLLRDELGARIQEIRRSPAFWNVSLKGHKRLVHELLALTQRDSHRPPRRKIWSRQRCRAWLLRFGNSRRPYSAQRAREEIPKFLDTAGQRTFRYGVLNDIESVRQVVASGLAELAHGREFAIKASDINPETSICAVPGAGYIHGHARDIFLLAVRDFIASPSGRAIAKCKYQGCSVLIVRHRRQLYCSSKCSRAADAERSRKRRAAISPEERSRQRRERYQRSVGLKRKIRDRRPRPRKLAESASSPPTVPAATPRTVKVLTRTLELLARLAAFPNGASVHELVQIFGTREKSVVQSLADLARKSLVIQATDGRWLALAAPLTAPKQIEARS